MTDVMMVRQGDVLLVRADHLPEGVVPVEREDGRVVLAYGEVTGHHHSIVEAEAELFRSEDVDELADRWLRVETEVALAHQEHDTIVLEPGVWRVVRQREYTSADMPPLRVAD